MKAIVQERYGPIEEVLELRDLQDPAPGPGQVLVRAAAASVHIGDCHQIRGIPRLFRPLVYGTRRPRMRIPGTDVAGVVETVGPDVTRFTPGDEVLGGGSGAFAMRVVANEGALVRKPVDLGFAEASAVGVSALTALQALRDHGRVKSGQRVVVVGASGGVGTFAVQIAKAMGAEVTGVCSTRNVELVRSIGADHVIDYTVEDFTAGTARYDLVFDNVGKQSLASLRRPLTPSGRLLPNGVQVGAWVGGLGRTAATALSSIVVRRQARPFVSMPKLQDLEEVLAMVTSGRVRPVIDLTVPLAQAAEAVAHVASGHTRGTSVITIADDGVPA